MKTILVVNTKFIAKSFDEKSFFCTFLGFIPHWDYKHYTGYVSQKFMNLGKIENNHSECDVIGGFVVNGSSQPILYYFVSDNPPG